MRFARSTAALYGACLCAVSAAFAPASRAEVSRPPATPRVVLLASDGAALDAERDHVAISRDWPSLDADDSPPPPGAASEREAVRIVIAASHDVASTLRVSTWQSAGGALDSLTPALAEVVCPSRLGNGECWSTPLLRLALDHLDRAYPAFSSSSLEGELGGALRVEVSGRKFGEWRVGAPHSPAFAGIDRLALRLRVRVLRTTPHGAPTLGEDRATALEAARREVRAAGKLWAQCGIDLQGPAGLDVELVDPPNVRLAAIGCDAGLPASGGEITLRVGGRRVQVRSRPSEPPVVVAARLVQALARAGAPAEVSRNARNNSGASSVVDVVLRGPSRLAFSADPKRPLSSDATLNVCLGEVALEDGLSHFVENDAGAGTLEERALVKAFDDGDPTTVELLIVPSFGEGGRIGESFIDDDGAGIQNTVIIDRAAVRAGPRSYALAHELGHVLLDMPGHPDDFGVDQSSSLMDSDAADASRFGPRRLSLDECERVLRESGPRARVPLLTAWPFSPKTAEHGPTPGR